MLSGFGAPRTDTLQTVGVTVDFGGAEVVAPPTFAPDYAVRTTPGSKRGTKYRTAIGNMVVNLGEKRITMRAEAGGKRTTTFQIADVTKPFTTAGRNTAKGHNIVLGDDDAYICTRTQGQTPHGGQRFRDEDAPGYKTTQSATKENGKLLRVLALTWQED